MFDVDTDEQSPFDVEQLRDSWARYGHDLLLHDPAGPQECLVRSGELLVAADRLDAVLSRLRRWTDSVEEHDDLRLARVRLRRDERARCVEMAWDPGLPGVSVNHVHFGAPVMYGTPVMCGTGAEAEAAPPVAEPPREQWHPPVTIGVLDTGCDPHPWFSGRPWFTPVPEVLDADDDSGQDRQAGHGTFVNGVLLQHAPGADIRTRRALSSLGFTDDLAVAAGLRSLRLACAARGRSVDVLVLTAGCYTAEDTCPQVLQDQLAGFPESVVVAAAGNHASSRPFWPAALPDVVAVAATGPDGALATFSNRGSWVDAAAPGVDVVSSFVRLTAGGGRSYGFARWSGTSFAAPRVAGEIALALSTGSTPDDARDLTCKRYPVRR